MKKINNLLLLGMFLLGGVSTSFASTFDSLPLSDAIKTVKGDGSRKMAVFADPNCPFSKKYEAELQKINNVTIYTFITPLQGQSSVELATGIYCSNNPSSSWKNWMLNGTNPGNASCNTVALTRNIPLYKKVGARGTPYTLLEDGNDIGGAAPAQEIEKVLQFANRKVPKTTPGVSGSYQAPQVQQEVSSNVVNSVTSGGLFK